MNQPVPLIPFQIPAYPKPLSISQARVVLPPEEFRTRLRAHLLDHPGLTLAQVAQHLNVTRQRVNLLVGKLNRPSCAHPNRPAPKTEAARRGMVKLVERVRAGEPAEQAAKALDLSMTQVMRLGFRVRKFCPPHGTRLRAVGDEGVAACPCWRCRRAVGKALRRGRPADQRTRAEVLDWCAWRDPDSGEGLRQIEIGRLTGIGQGAVSRIVRSVESENKVCN